MCIRIIVDFIIATAVEGIIYSHNRKPRELVNGNETFRTISMGSGSGQKAVSATDQNRVTHQRDVALDSRSTRESTRVVTQTDTASSPSTSNRNATTNAGSSSTTNDVSLNMNNSGISNAPDTTERNRALPVNSDASEVIDSACFRRPAAWVDPYSTRPPRTAYGTLSLNQNDAGNGRGVEVIESAKFRRPEIWTAGGNSPHSDNDKKQPSCPLGKTKKSTSGEKHFSDENSKEPTTSSKPPKPLPESPMAMDDYAARPTAPANESRSLQSDTLLTPSQPLQSNDTVVPPRQGRNALKASSEASSHLILPTETSTIGEGVESSITDSAAADKFELDTLHAELMSRLKWEAVRLQEAVRAQMLEDKKAAAKLAAEVQQKHEQEVARIREIVTADTMNLMAERSRELKEKHEREREEKVTKLLQAREEDLRNEVVADISRDYERLSSERYGHLTTSEADVKALLQRFEAVVGHTECAKDVSKIASGAFVLREAIHSGIPLEKDLAVSCGQSELGELIQKSMPKIALCQGVRSEDDLKRDFNVAAKRGLSVAVIPEDKTGSVWAHMLGSIFSRLKIAVDMRAEGTSEFETNEERIRFAKQLVNEGNLEGAIGAVKKVDGLAGEVLSDWVDAAKARITANLAADVLLADAIVSQVDMSKGEAS